MDDTVAVRVARGAALLDEKLPGWADRIDLGTLSLSSTCNCVLGQLWGAAPGTDDDSPYTVAMYELLPDEDDAEHGFTLSFREVVRGAETDLAAMWAALDVEWVRVITERRPES